MNRIKPHIRWMIRRDTPEVLEIESLCFFAPWTGEDFIRCLRQRNCLGMVAEHDNRVVGFMIYEWNKTRLHVLNFAVLPSRQRSGVGRQMVEKLKGKLSSEWRNTILLEVRDSNLDAQLFFHAMGFRASGVLRAFYDDTVEDAYVFRYRCQKSFDWPGVVTT